MPEDGTVVEEVGALPGSIVLPIEVLPLTEGEFNGTAPYFVAQQITLDDSDALALQGGSLYLRAHGLAWRDGADLAVLSVAKGAVSWDNNPPVQLMNAPTDPSARNYHSPPQVVIDGLDGLYGGIGGGYRTVKLRIPFSALCATSCATRGTHTLKFYWNGTDGTGSSYRIVELNLRTAGNVDRLPATTFTTSDPATWTEPLTSTADVAAGDALFHARHVLKNRPGGHAITASCSDCHARDGGDLEYFAYSNGSIQNRAAFHGLTANQGLQIASYIRSLPVGRYGRPWNPPYQPGSNRDRYGQRSWSAGAGLGAVQPETSALLGRLFPHGTTDPASMVDDLRGVGMDAATLNLRELPVQIQLPDWNSWLPEVHPIDLWGECAWDAGDGSFDLTRSTATGLASAATGLAVADLDGDQRLDVVAALPFTDQLSVLRGSAGTALIPPTAPLSMGTKPTAVALADLTGDGKLDVVSANRDSNDLSVRAGNGNATFGDVATRTSGRGPRALATGDFNGDGKLDVAVALFDDNKLAIHFGNGTTTLGAANLRAAGSRPIDLVAADLDDDLDLDLAVVSSGTNQVLVYSNVAGSGVFSAATALTVGGSPQAIAVGDVDGDHKLDLVTANQGGNSISVLRRTAAGYGWLAATTITGVSQPRDVALSDLDDDGDLDLLVSEHAPDQVRTVRNAGAGTYAVAASITVDNAGPLAVADLDLDGADDLLIASTLWGTLTAVPAHTCAVTTPSVAQAYQNTRATLAAYNWSDATAVDQLPEVLGALDDAAFAFLSYGWQSGNGNGGGHPDGYRTIRSTTIDAAVTRGYSFELVKRSLAQWQAVKYWELMRSYQLEELGPQVYDVGGVVYGEVLSWPMGSHRATFQIAPHILAEDRDQFRAPSEYPADSNACPACSNPLHAAQSLAKAKYDSTAWYHLQMVLHSGARNWNSYLDHENGLAGPAATAPVDWPYSMIHVDDLDRIAAATPAAAAPGAPSAWESVRYLATMMKTYQMRDNGVGPGKASWSMRDVSPRLLVSNWGGDAQEVDLLTHLDDLDGGLRAKVTNAFLTAFLDITSQSEFLIARGHGGAYENWPRFAEWDASTPEEDRPDQVDTWWKLDASEHLVNDRFLHPPRNGIEFPAGGLFSHADDLWIAIPMLRSIAGVDFTKVNDLRDWSAMMWPENDWSTR